MDQYDTSQLTEFPRFEPESTQSGVSTFLNKLWKLPIFSPGETAESSQNKALTDGKEDSPRNEDGNKQEYDDIKTEPASYAVEFEGRSLQNVLSRITSLVALGSSRGTKYTDTEHARYWMPDDISRECYECAARFGALRRRHHCRVCGQIFCARCCSQRVPGQIFGCAGGLRVCNYCCNVVLSYLHENEMTGEISPDLRTLQENLQVKFPDNKSQTSKSRDHFMFAREQDERPSPSPKEALHDVFRQLAYMLPTRQHRYRLVRYNGVWRGCDILQWIMDNTSHKTRAQATLVCQSLLSAGLMESVSECVQWADYALYRPAAPGTHDTTDEEHTKLVESVSSYCLDLDLGESSARLTKNPKAIQTEPKTPSSEEETPNLEQTEGPIETTKLCKALEESGEDHLKLLMRQFLASYSLSSAWLDILLPLCVQAADTIMPDMHSSDIDVRNYVQVKKLRDGSTKDCRVIPGVVLTKNVAHKAMPQRIENPSVLLLDCSIAYQRVEGKLTSLEPVLLQEQEYLVRCAARINALSPDVVLVRGSAARAVQDALRAAGVALAANVGARALARAARCLRADAAASVDARVAAPRLGAARLFSVNTYPSKTLMSLEGCAEPQLGCCVLLCGAPLSELARVKKVVKFMLLACYNWKLEKAFLADIEAILPEPGMTFEDDEKPVEDNVNNGDIANVIENDGAKENVDESEITNVESENSKNDENKVSEENKDNDTVEEADKITEVEKENDQNEKFDDPLTSKFMRKPESDRLSCGVPIRDFSDPLRATMSVDDDVFLPTEEDLKADNQAERWSTDDTILSMSPNIVVPPPYLETESGRRCPLRKYYPSPLLPPPRAPHTPRPRPRQLTHAHTELKEVHPFIARPITATADDPALKAALAHYRATGCRLDGTHKPECPMYKPSVVKPVIKEPEVEEKPAGKEDLNPLDPENHQKLSVLLYSYSRKSANAPDFCVNPWIMTMEMYGRHDITLGAFLEKYCFNSEYKCTSNNCSVPVNQHVRRFVHGDACITLTCNIIQHSSVDKMKDEQNKQVMFWSRCEICSASGRARRLSRAALCVSLAVYLRARAACARPLRARACRHALHAHAHVFARATAAACCRFMKITPYEIELPPDVISVQYDTKAMRDALINQLNELMLKGHETFSNVADTECEKDYQAFKHHTEQIHVALTHANLHENNTKSAVVRSLWNVSDRIILGEKMLRDAQEQWASPAAKTKPPPDAPAEEKPEEETEADSTTYVFNETKDEKDHGTEEDEEKGDKKTVRQILSQLLSNKEASNQSGIIIVSGMIPVVVMVGEIGSVIAATLASVTYQRTLRTQRHSNQSEQEDNETTAGKEKTDNDKNKAAKSNDHIEVLLKDGLLCRVYYAPQFHKLRHALMAAPDSPDGGRCCDVDKADSKALCDIEEGFIRSLAHCVPWAAKGGKSGSTFCKTKDDRYVLKEMTKPEWQQFLEFAPHYFSYVTSCRNQQLPSLLARILGVYSVGGAGNGVLVMENVWHSCGAAQRFDLKGSSRHRLAPPAPMAVLLDENLLQLRWDEQLFVQSHTGGVLFSCIDRDTEFLSANSVMDYSLLLGIDGKRLVLGIIDYIRTFTWDKKLEHLVKKNLGSGQPTVVSPDEYKRRFRAATRKYFLRAAGPWDHLL